MAKHWIVRLGLIFIALTVAMPIFAEEELVFWNFWDTELIAPVIEKFEAENPGVKIRNEQLTWNNGLDKIIVSMANNRAPDICEMGSTWMGKFVSEGALLDVTDKFSDLKDKYLMWEPVQMNGRLYGMPWLVGTRVVFYNKDLLAKAGLDPEKPPVTWQQLLDACKAIHNPKEGVFGFGMNAGEGHILYKKFLPLAWGNGAKVLDENGNFVFDSQEMREALEYYLELQKYSYCEKQDLLDEAFKQGRLGLAISGSWNFSRYPIEAPNLNFGTCLMPKPAENKGFSTAFMGGEILVLFKSCKNPDLAAKFVRYIAEAQNTLPITKKAWTTFPASVETYSDECFSDPRLQVFFEQMKTSIHPPVCKNWIELENIINKTVEKAMYGESIDAAFASARSEYEGIIARQKNISNNQPLSSNSNLQATNNEAKSIRQNANADGQTIENERQTNIPSVPSTYSLPFSLTLLLSLIGVGTLINAVLMAFILYELKKKD